MNEPTLSPELELRVELERLIRAPIADVFEAVIEEIGSDMQSPDGVNMQLRLEPFPGGRWYRDLGDDNGHLWGHVQAIRRPDLLEVRGPMFMSQPVTNNVQYRLEEEGDATRLRFVHTAFGPIPADTATHVTKGWNHQLDQILKRFP